MHVSTWPDHEKSEHETHELQLRAESLTSFQTSEYLQLRSMLAASQSEPVYNDTQTFAY